MKRTNVKTWKEFYENNIFCKHIIINNGAMMNKKNVCIYQDKKIIFKWICEECQNNEKINIVN